MWTSAGVLVGVGAVALTGWERLDPLVALAVAANIVWSGVHLIQRSAHGLLDVAACEADRRAVGEVLELYRAQGIGFHALRTRQAGARAFIDCHVLVPPQWTVKRGHDLVEEVERDIRARVAGAHVFTHLEPLGDPASDADQALDRAPG